MGRIYGSGRRHSAHDRKQTDLPVKKRNHRADLRYSERTAWISIYTVCRKSTDGNESRAYLCMHEFEKTGKDPGKTRLEHSQIFVDFEENKKKRSFKRKMVLGITPNTKFVYSLKSPEIRGFYYVAGNSVGISKPCRAGFFLFIVFNILIGGILRIVSSVIGTRTISIINIIPVLIVILSGIIGGIFCIIRNIGSVTS